MEFTLGNLCVKTYIWSRRKNRFIDAYAIFDTGAHITHIDTIGLENLGYDLTNAATGYINTVGNSNMQINNTVIDNIKIGDFETGAVFVNFSALSDINAPMIIGMNIIKEFNITLDFKNMKMLLEPNFDVDSKIPVENFSKHNSRFGMWTINAEHNE
jgi:hypothetical protein